MAHGAPDYGVGAPKATIYRLQDMAELAVRLGSIVSFDRRGDVIFLDDFEDGIVKWVGAAFPLTGSVASDTTYARSGAKCVKMVTGAVSGALAQLTWYGAYPALSKLGLELSWASQQELYNIDLNLYAYDGTKYLQGALSYDRPTYTLRYFDSTGAWVALAASLQTRELLPLWNTLKLVMDPVTGRYVRALFGATEYDMSALDLYSDASGFASHLIATAVLTAQEAVAKTAYLDDVIITQNEP